MIKIGQGIDVHAFHNSGAQQQYVVLAGVHIEHSHSLLAHSDGDVVLHALADAMLGAVALGDIGQHFLTLMPRMRVWIRGYCCAMSIVRYRRPDTC